MAEQRAKDELFLALSGPTFLSAVLTLVKLPVARLLLRFLLSSFVVSTGEQKCNFGTC